MGKGFIESIPRAVMVTLSNPLRAMTLAKKKLSAPRVPENSSFCYVREDEKMSTTIYLYNYWSENYKIERPEITFNILNADGKNLGKKSVVLEPNASAAVRVGDILTHVNVPTPFEGTVLTTITSPHLVDKRPLQMNVDYFYANGSRVSGVHSQWGKLSEPKKEMLASFHVDVKPDINTHVVFRNTFHQTKNVPGVHAQLSLINHRGVKMVQNYPDISPHGMKKISVRDHFPNTETFLEGKHGNLEVTSSAEMGRCLFYHEMSDGSFCFDHATQYLGEQEDFAFTLEQMKQMGIGTVGVGPVYVSGERDTYVIPFADFFQKETVYSLDLTIFDANGKTILMRPRAATIHPGETPRIAMGSLLSEEGISLPFEGVYRLSYHVAETIPRYPRTFHTITGYTFPRGKTEYQFDSGLFNMPTHNFSNEYQTSKIFSRVLVNENFNTMIFLTNASGETGYSKTSATTLSVFDPSGKTVAEKTIAIPANGCVFVHLEKEFPSLKKDLSEGNGVGTVKVRDRTTRIVGAHFILGPNGDWLASDHLVGG